jgi:hypothetical protein
MTDYWCRFLDRASRAYAGEKFHCADLAEAIAKARLILRDGQGIGFEIWENSHRIYAERPSPEHMPVAHLGTRQGKKSSV